MSVDRISLSNGAIDRTLPSNGTEEIRSSSPSSKSRAIAGDDAISLSDNARNAGRISHMMNSSRSSRLDAVREGMANGTYKVSGTDIASRLITLNTR